MMSFEFMICVSKMPFPHVLGIRDFTFSLTYCGLFCLHRSLVFAGMVFQLDFMILTVQFPSRVPRRRFPNGL